MEQGCLSTEDMQLLKKIGITTFYFTDVDYAIECIRKKYNVIIYHRIPPFVDSSGKIKYSFIAKYCSKTGWSGGIYIDTPNKLDSNIYEAKRRAIRAAAQWILAHKCKKINIKSAKK